MSSTLRFYLETPRLILRDLLPEDNNGMFEVDSDPEVVEYLGKKPVTTLEESEAIIRFVRHQYETMGTGRLAVLLKENNEFLGWAGLKYIAEPINGKKDFFDIGYRFKKSAWGKGYATEAAEALLKNGLKTISPKLIKAYAHSENQKSIHVLEKIGFKKTDRFMFDGEEHVMMEL
jgi:[ribosomal protein S5]-alanine N-acetyltransferase